MHFASLVQEPDASKDEELCKNVHARINGEEPSTDSGPAAIGGMDQGQLLAMLTGQGSSSSGAQAEQDQGSSAAAASTNNANMESSASSMSTPHPTTPAPASMPTPVQQQTHAAPARAAGPAGGSVSTASLAAILSNLGSGGGGGGGGMAHAQAEAMKGASLLDVMDSKGLLDVLASMPESDKARLFEELPAGDGNAQGLREVRSEVCCVRLCPTIFMCFLVSPSALPNCLHTVYVCIHVYIHVCIFDLTHFCMTYIPPCLYNKYYV